MNSSVVQIQDAIMHRLPKTGHSYFMYLGMFKTLRIRQDEKTSFYDLFWVAKQVGGYAKKNGLLLEAVLLQNIPSIC